jgi:ketosteroid isomerase-like protein
MDGPVSTDRCEIRVAGVLDARWADSFEGFTIAADGDETVISGAVRDEAELHGLLARVGDLGLTLLQVRRLARPCSCRGPASGNERRNTVMNAETTGTRAEVLDLGRRWADAELRGDAEALAPLLAGDFVNVGPLGFLLDQQQYLGSRRSGDLRHESFAWDDVQVRVYGDTAVAVGTQTQRSTYRDHDASGRFRVTQVLVRRDGRLVIASMHESPIAQPPAPGGRP